MLKKWEIKNSWKSEKVGNWKKWEIRKSRKLERKKKQESGKSGK